jgi:hypothetical protein
MHQLHHSQNSSSLTKPAHWSRALLAVSLASVFASSQAGAQTYFNLAAGNYSENFSTITTPWPALTSVGNASSNSISGLAIDSTGAIPSATRITAATTAYTTGATGGAQIGTGNIQLLSTGGSANTSSTGIGLNLDFTGRASGNLSFDAATVFNSTGDRLGSLRVYFSINGTTWTEITGTNLPYVATNNVVGSAAINVPIPTAVNGNNQVKLRFYYHNGPNGTTGSRPKISIDNIAVTSLADGSADTTPPLASTLSPTNGATGVLIDTNVVSTFNELVQAGTGTVLLQKTAGAVTVPAAVTISGSTLTIDPTADLEYSTAYSVVIPPGAIKDIANNPFGGIPATGTWAFTTIAQDVTPPTIASVSPTGLGVASTSTLTVTFNENVNPIGGDIVLKKADGTVIETIAASSFTTGFSVSGAVVTIQLTTPLDYGVSYYVQIAADAFEDDSENAFDGILAPDTTTWSFTTVDVPSFNGSTYTQTFSTYNSATTLPSGWSAIGGPGYLSGYIENWGLISVGGFRGNASVYGYHHTSLTQTSAVPLNQILTLRNTTGAVITDLSVAYKGRFAIPANTRIPVFTVSVVGTPVPALGYSTADSDNAQRNAAISGLSIANNATFQIKWASSYPTGAGSARQIGISDVSVSLGSTLFKPTVAVLNIPIATIGSISAEVQADVIADGGQALTDCGFVFSQTSLNPTPVIGGPNVTQIAVSSPALGPYSSTLTGLLVSTGYSVRAYATNASGITYTDVSIFNTLAPSPNFVTSYTQAFANYNGTNPAGWAAISDAVPPVQNFVGDWGTQSTSGGFLGSATPADAGVLGYRHTGSTGNLTVTLRLINGTGATLTSLNVGYKGRVNDTEETRSPEWAVSVNGSPAVAALAYSTLGNVDAVLATTVTGLTIPAGAEFSISWVSNRGLSTGSSKQIGIGAVSVSAVGPPANTYASWASANGVTGGFNGDSNSDGVPNGVAYFYGATGSAVVANPQLVNNKVTYPKDATATGATGVIQTSTDLVTWSPQTSNTSVPGFTSYTLPTGQGKIFVRLSVTPVTP